ncbi:hypothetical protein CHS0354_004931 [Potamilus streckersoni]|uniref:Retrotransposon gag domain-containing protein n=1 Tax=Potamilus streckersoni TaxID=2493646 RepID=A0AAE0WFD9_9BIVA|nr:hypothetical protein CHS0354_004931 [Potamilus streckersoni]
MSRGVTPHNYNLRRRPAPVLLTPSHFTPSDSAKSKTAATAPPFSIDRSLLPPTSILLDGTPSTYTSPVTIYPPTPILLHSTSSTYTSPATISPTTSILLQGTFSTYTSLVTIYPPLSTLPTILTSSTHTTPTPASAPVLLPLPQDVLIDLTPSTPTPAPVIDRSRDLTSLPLIDRSLDSTLLPPAPSRQLNLPETNSPVLLTPHRTLFSINTRTTLQNFPIESQTRTFTNSSQTEHSSGPASVLGNNRFIHTEHFTQWAKFYDLSDEKALNAFPFQLKRHANVWYDTLPENVTHDWHLLVNDFKSRFHHDDVILDLPILQTHQGSSESVMDYLGRLFQTATNKPSSDQVLLAVALNGLKLSVKRIVINNNPANMAELRQATVLAEKSIATTDTTDLSALNTILNEVKQLKDEVAANSKQTKDSISSLQKHAHINATKLPFLPPTSNYRSHDTYYTPFPPAHSHDTYFRSNPTYTPPPSAQSHNTYFRPNQTYTSPPSAFPQRYPRRHSSSQPSRAPHFQPQTHTRHPTPCIGCGKHCTSSTICPARNAQCHYCHKIGHFSRVCLSTRKQ